MMRVPPIKIVFLFIATALSFALSAQDWTYVVNGRVLKGDNNLEGAVVTLYKNGGQAGQMVTKKNGKYSFVLEPNNDYTISYTKAGHCNKKIFVSTKNVPSDRAQFGFSNQPIDIEIFELPQDASISSQISTILNDPIAKFVYVPSEKDFDYDKKYTDEMREKLKKLKKIQEDIEKGNSENAFKDAQYQDAMKTGDALYNQGKWLDAINAYKKAGEIKPDEQGPKDKIKDSQTKLDIENKKKELKAKYDAAVKKGDDAFKLGQWQNAITAYTEANSYLPEEPYPSNQIKLCQQKLDAEKNNKELKEKFDALVKQGDASFSATKYDDAIKFYTDALQLIPAEQYPKDQIIACNKAKQKIIDDKNALETKYLMAIKKGDDAFKLSKWQDAINAYNEALTIKNGDKYATDQIVICKKKIEETTLALELEEKYKTAIKKGDDAFKASLWQDAIAAYNEALAIKKNEPYPVAQIKLCQQKIDAEKSLKDLQVKYDAAIKKGDDAFKLSQWQNAITAYTEALTYKKGEPYPTGQVKLCQEKIDAEKNLKDLQAKYLLAVKKGDDAFKLGKWTDAITAYNEALSYKKDESYPAVQIKLCQEKLDADEAQKELDAKYTIALKKADDLFKLGKWQDAITAYNEALSIKPKETYPSAQIGICQKKLDDEKLFNENSAKYAAALKKADELFSQSKWEDAIVVYTEALTYKKGEPYPVNQITLCKERIQGLKDLQVKYDNAIKKGDAAFNASKWQDAITAYNEALTIKKGEKYPTDQIAVCQGKLNDVNALQAKYDAAVKKGDGAFKLGQWQNAIDAYNEALTFKPKEIYPPAQIKLAQQKLDIEKNQKDIQVKYDAAIKKGDDAFKTSLWQDAITAYNEALTYKKGEPYPTAQIKLAQQKIDADKNLKDLQVKYDAAVKKGDDAFKLGQWQNAITAYTEALTYKKGEPYPTGQIKLCQEKIDADKNLKDQYILAVKKGDDAFKLGKWQDAINAYNEALGIKANEPYPTGQIKICQQKIDAEKVGNDLQAKYDAAIKKGDENFKSMEFSTAKMSYEEALTYKKGEPYPIAQIKLCQQKIDAEIKYKDALAKADKLFQDKKYPEAKTAYQGALVFKDDNYPKEQIKLCQQYIDEIVNGKENRKKYDAAIKDADKLYNARDWQNALNKYTEASGYLPGEKYPQDKITEINGILAKIKADQDKINAEKELNDKYNAAVNKGDVLFAKKDYLNSKAAYQEALTYMPTQTYPKMQIDKIDKILQQQINNDPSFKEYQTHILAGDKAFNEKRYQDALDSYTKALALKPEEKHPKNRIDEINAILKDKQINMEKDQVIIKYNELIKKADILYGQRNWTKAKIIYNEALSLQPNENYPKERITSCDLFLKEDNNPVVKNTTTYQTDEEYEKARKKRYNDLTAKYGGPGRYEVPEVTDGGKKISEYVIITETDAFVYKKITFSFGQVQYTKNDIAINRAEYEAAVNTP